MNDGIATSRAVTGVVGHAHLTHLLIVERTQTNHNSHLLNYGINLWFLGVTNILLRHDIIDTVFLLIFITQFSKTQQTGTTAVETAPSEECLKAYLIKTTSNY